MTPTVYLRIGNSAIAFEETGEILETVTFNLDGSPHWEHSSICDYRGAAGGEGYELLRKSLDAAELNAHLADLEIVRIPRLP